MIMESFQHPQVVANHVLHRWFSNFNSQKLHPSQTKTIEIDSLPNALQHDMNTMALHPDYVCYYSE